MTVYPRDNDSLGTPEWILDRVRSTGPIGLDPCSNRWSTVGAVHSCALDRHEDGLADPWWLAKDDGSIWHNPPYSNPRPWCRRAVEAYDHGSEVFSLLKLDPSTEWSRIMRSRPRAVCDFDKRIRFEGGKYAAGAMASTLVYHGPRPYLFCHVFQDVGEVSIRPASR